MADENFFLATSCPFGAIPSLGRPPARLSGPCALPTEGQFIHRFQAGLGQFLSELRARMSLRTASLAVWFLIRN